MSASHDERAMSASRVSMHGPTWLVAAAFAATTLIRIGDADVFGHLATGRLILETGAIPTRDAFSYASLGPLRYTEALAQVVYALVHRASGFGGLVAMHGAMMLALGLWVARVPRAGAMARALALATFGAAIYPATTLKPQVFSYICFAGLLTLLRRGERGESRALYALPPLFLAWGFLHRAGLLGLGVVAGAGLATLAAPATRKAARPLAVAGLASLAALLLNPGGLFYLSASFDVASRSSFHEHLAEWQPLTLARLFSDHLALVPLAALAAYERLRTRARPDVELVALGATAVTMLGGARLVPFFAIAAMPPAARALEGLFAIARSRAGEAVRPAVARALGLAVSFGLLAGLVLPRVPPAFFGFGLEESLVPVHLAEVVRGSNARGRLHHAFDFGGYFVFALAPERKVLIDGRNDTVYSDAHFLDVLRSTRDAGVFARLDARHGFGVSAMPWSSPAGTDGLFLARDPSWALVTWDDRGAVYVRRSAVTPAYLAAHAYEELRVDTAFDRAMRAPAARGQLDASDARFVRELERNVRECPRSARAWFVLALAKRARGDAEGLSLARRELTELVRARDLDLPIP